MAKKKEVLEEQPVEEPTTSVEPPSGGTTTLSTRLSVEQKNQIEEAAQLRSWTSSQFMRQAAVERAAHIINAERRSDFDFGVVAEKIASQLCNPELSAERGGERETIRWTLFDNGDAVIVSSLDLQEIYHLMEAVHFGGVEFMEQVMTLCERKLETSDLPSPIDPHTE